MKKIALYIFSLFFLVQTANAQDENYDSLLNYYLQSDSILLDELEQQLTFDSLDIFDLIDSLLLKDYRYSQLSLRLGYTSDITYAGRNFGFNQYGLNGGISYYHKTGLFGDVSGFWNSSLSPSYNPTITTLGYMGNLTKKWTYTISYDHFFYNSSNVEDSITYYPLTNSANVSTYFEMGDFTVAGDYSLLFGEESAHRLRFNLMYTFSKNNWGFIDRFVFMPSTSVLLGNATIYQATPVYLDSRSDVRQAMVDEYGAAKVWYWWRHDRKKYYDMAKELIENYDEYEYTADNKFGIMNYSLSAPFYFYIDNFTVALSYFYNIPVPLPGEDINLENNSYVGASLIYNIPFRKKKK